VADDVRGRDVEHLHIADYRSADALVPGAVLVVGAAQSGGQIADDLLRAGRRVLVSTSPVGRVPRTYRGRDLMAWWRDMGRLDAAAQTADEQTRRAAQPLIAGGRSLSLQSLARSGATLLGRLAAADGDRLWFTGEPAEHAAAGDAVAARQRALVDRWLAESGRLAPPAEPDEAPLTRAEAPAHPVVDLRRTGVRTVIWATGFRGDYGWLRMPILDTGGKPINRGVETVSRGLFVVGVPWLRLRSSGNLYGIERDAAVVAARITGADRVAAPLEAVS
jgi:putative flavoprotein involved in K+ transport